MQIIEGRLHEELLRITLLRAPFEACGIISSNGLEVIEVPNRSAGVESQFEASRGDIMSAIKNLDDEDMSDITFFHTHPAGMIGPSKLDLDNRGPFPNHLVVSLVDADIVHTWY